MRDERTKQAGWRAVVKFAPLWGGLACIGFYAALPVIPWQQDLLIRYCTSHPLEYVTMALFFLGMATLILRRIELAGEQSALTQLLSLVGKVFEKSSERLDERADALGREIELRRIETGKSVAGRRVAEALHYVDQMKSGDRLDEHLRHLSDLEADAAAQRLGFVNTISWAVPILGFLGTVMGITLAIANVTPDQLDKSLPEVTGGLAVAFDTTALSLSLSLVLVFSTFIVRRKQDEILAGIDQQLDHRLGFLLAQSASQPLQVHSEVSGQLVEATTQLVSEATAIWRNNLSALEETFAVTVREEQLRVADVLRESLQGNLAAHQQELAAIRERESAAQGDLLKQVETGMQRWESSVAMAAEALSRQTQELGQHSELLANLNDHQKMLAETQQQIHESLDSQNIAATLDQTLNSLTAAIQLLNARVNVSSRAA